MPQSTRIKDKLYKVFCCFQATIIMKFEGAKSEWGVSTLFKVRGGERKALNNHHH